MSATEPDACVVHILQHAVLFTSVWLNARVLIFHKYKKIFKNRFSTPNHWICPVSTLKAKLPSIPSKPTPISIQNDVSSRAHSSRQSSQVGFSQLEGPAIYGLFSFNAHYCAPKWRCVNWSETLEHSKNKISLVRKTTEKKLLPLKIWHISVHF